jgi:hypothetical protein
MSFATPLDGAAAEFPGRLFVACALAWSAGLLYLVAALHHVDDRPVAVVAALVVSAALFAWTAALYRIPSGAVRAAGVVLALAALALWAATDPARAAGDALGPLAGTVFVCKLLPGGIPLSAAQWTPAALQTLVSIANVDVLALAAIVAAARAIGRLAALPGAALVLLSCVSLGIAAGGHVH